ncbi:hypothetical protein ScPMuIL_006287 [Solemya velum]
MGNMMYAYVTNPDTVPDYNAPPTFDPLQGFPNGRKERVINVTREELDKANIDLNRRDYCVDLYYNFMKCRRIDGIFAESCQHIKHDHDKCEFDDYVLRMKEFEREKRMKERAKRLMQKSQAEALTD